MPLPIPALLATAGPSLLKGFQKYWKVLGVALVAAALYFYISGLKSDLAECETSKSALSETIGGLKHQLVEANAAIDAQNAAIDAQEEQLREADEQARDIIHKKRIEIEKMKSELEELMDIVNNVPEKIPQTCDESIDYLRDGVEDLKW